MGKIRPLMFIPPLLFLLLVGVFLVGNFREDRNELPSTLIGREGPEMVLGELDGRAAFVNEDLRGGEVSLVNFWASWCPPCRAEMPFFADLTAQGFTIYGVNARDDPDNAQAFLNELGNPFAGIGTSRDGRAAIDWGVYGMPETFVVDGEGRVVARFAGEVTERVWRDRLLPAIEAARAR
ncbi:DsbE family thiol:disulfide interchange protein [Rhodobaculum claviforme]|uniref:Thiol:disulfide interchange protein n=1 Tax=Rhodobaculum claviforme TaxID=1549854 RepID=A0A934TJV7_9RHOB|nr:DsbE family thiol:disulfide interchange protein [Rhodobaculum claviforme]MBK5926547.1 thiol:disulfide interchange protein [Rhodobaculum claviforme]